MSPKPDVSAERKDQIMNAAEEVFSKKGLDNARMDDIAEETKLSKGTLYLYFKSKDDLIIAIVDRIFQHEFKEMENLDITQITATEGIWKFTEMATKDLSAMLRLMPVAYEVLALAFRNKVIQTALKLYFRRYMDVLIPIIQKGIDSGEFKQVDAREVAIAAGSIFEGTILLWVYDKSMVDPITNIRSSIKLLLDGVVKTD